MKDSKSPQTKYSQEEWANLMFFGNHVDFSMQLNEVKAFLNEFQKYIEATNHHLRIDDIKEYDIESLDDLKYYFEHTHGDILRRSTVISLVTLLELKIGEYCDEYQKHLKARIRIKDLRGDFLRRFKTYSLKVLDSTFDFQSSLWHYIVGFYEIRNCFVHNGGSLNNYGKRPTIENFISGNKLFEITASDHIDVTFDGCIEAIEKIEHFFVIITEIAFDQFPGRYRSKNA